MNKRTTTPSKPLGRLSPAASRLARRAGGYATLASQGAEALGQRLRDGRMDAARRAVDPEGALAPDDRERRAEAHVKAQRYQSLAHAQQVKADRKASAERRESRQRQSHEARARAAVEEARRTDRETRQSLRAAYWGAAVGDDDDATDDGWEG